MGKRSIGRPKDVAANGGKRTRCAWVDIMSRGGTEGGRQGGMADSCTFPMRHIYLFISIIGIIYNYCAILICY